MERDEYLREREILLAREGNAADKYDRTIILLSAGAIVVSISFLSLFNSTPDFMGLLFLTWGLFIISLIVALTNLLISQVSFNKQRDILNKQYTNKNAVEIEENIFRIMTGKLNLVSLLCTIIGRILLSIFSGININKMENKMSEQSKSVNSSGENRSGIDKLGSASAPPLPIRDINNTVEKAMGAHDAPVPPNPQGSEGGSADSPKGNDATTSNNSAGDGSKSSDK